VEDVSSPRLRDFDEKGFRTLDIICSYEEMSVVGGYLHYVVAVSYLLPSFVQYYSVFIKDTCLSYN